MSDSCQRRPIAVTIGDPAGVGPEVAAGAWAARRKHDLPPFVVIGDAAAITAIKGLFAGTSMSSWSRTSAPSGNLPPFQFDTP